MARLVLVHGAFAGAWCWERVTGPLRDAGHDVAALDLPGAGDDPTPVEGATLDAYAERICAVLAADERPAILVGHSIGGVAITQAAERCREHVAALVYVAAFLPADGQSIVDLTQLPEGAGEGVQANIVVDGDPPAATLPDEVAREVLFGACGDDDAAWGVARIRPQPLAPFVTPVRLGGSVDAIPCAYVMCLRDAAIPPPLQRRMSRERPCEPVLELDTDNSPWLSCPHELAEVLLRIVGPAPAPA